MAVTLEFVSTEEIMDELARRSQASMIALIPKTDGDAANSEENCISAVNGGAAALSWMAVVLMAYATREVDVGRDPIDEEEPTE